MKAVRLMFIMFLVMLLAGVLCPGFLGAASKPPCPAPPPVDRGLYDVLQKARRSLDAGRSRAALKILSAYAAAHPKKKHCHLSFLMGTAHYRLNQPTRAETCFMAAAALRPCAGEVWQNIGAVRCAQGDYAGAAAALSVAYRLESPAVDGWRELGDLYRLAGVPIKAVQAYRNAFGNDPAPEALDLLSDAWLEAHDLEKALANVRTAVNKAPTARRWARIGDICLRRGEHQASLAAYRKAAVLDDGDGRMSLMAGVAALKLARISDAETCFKHALSKASPQSDTARNASECLAALQATKKNAPFNERGMN